MVYPINTLLYNNTKIELPKPTKYETIIAEGFQDGESFRIWFYDELNETDLKDLEKIRDNSDNIKTDYLKLLEQFSNENQEIINQRFDKDKEIISDHYYKFYQTQKRTYFILVNLEEKVLYYYDIVDFDLQLNTINKSDIKRVK